MIKERIDMQDQTLADYFNKDISHINKEYDDQLYLRARNMRRQLAQEIFEANLEDEIASIDIENGMLKSILERTPFDNTRRVLQFNILLTRRLTQRILSNREISRFEKIGLYAYVVELGSREFFSPDDASTFLKHLGAAKDRGFFFTPPSVAIRMVALSLKYGKNITSLADPACGVGVFLAYSMLFNHNIKKVVGIELDGETAAYAKELLYAIARSENLDVEITVCQGDFFDYVCDTNATVDVLTKKRVSNNGIVPQYYVENNHEAIIPRQLFMQVQEELFRRAHLKTEGGKTKRVYSSKYALSSIVYCGKCGDLFRRVAWKARGASYNKWRCASRIEKGPKKGCDADAISEVELQNAVVRAINKTLGGREQFLIQLQYNIEEVLNGDSTATLEYIDQRMAELQEKLVLCVNKNAEYDVIANEIDALREKKAAVVTKDAEQEMLKKRIEEMRQFLQTQSSRVTEYDEQMVRRLIEKITVFDDKLIFEFKSGMTLELKR